MGGEVERHNVRTAGTVVVFPRCILFQESLSLWGYIKTSLKEISKRRSNGKYEEETKKKNGAFKITCLRNN